MVVCNKSLYGKPREINDSCIAAGMVDDVLCVVSCRVGLCIHTRRPVTYDPFEWCGASPACLLERIRTIRLNGTVDALPKTDRSDVLLPKRKT